MGILAPRVGIIINRKISTRHFFARHRHYFTKIDKFYPLYLAIPDPILASFTASKDK
jgi:hypothetical protein